MADPISAITSILDPSGTLQAAVDEHARDREWRNQVIEFLESYGGEYHHDDVWIRVTTVADAVVDHLLPERPVS